MESTLTTYWWHLVREDDVHAFRSFYTATVQAAGDHAFRLLKDREQAKDVLQEIYSAMYLRRQQITADNIEAYLHRAIKNRCLDVLKKSIEESEVRFSIVQDNNDNDNTEFLLKKIDEVVSSLSEKCRHAFHLRYYDRLSYREIALKMGVSVKTVEKHLSKALYILRERLGSQLLFLLLLGIQY